MYELHNEYNIIIVGSMKHKFSLNLAGSTYCTQTSLNKCGEQAVCFEILF